MKNKVLGILVGLLFVGFANASDQTYPPYYGNNGPTIEELQEARQFVSDLGFNKQAQLRVYVDSIPSYANDQYYLQLDICSAKKLSQCVRLGASAPFTGGDAGISVMNLKFAQMTSYKAYILAQLLQKEEARLVVSLYEKQPWYARNELLSVATWSLESLLSNPLAYFSENKFALAFTIELLQ